MKVTNVATSSAQQIISGQPKQSILAERSYFLHCVFTLLPMLLVACGGGGNNTPKSTSSITAVSSSSVVSSSSASTGADTQAPTVSDAKATISTENAVLSITANDNVDVKSVTFMIDDEAIQDVQQKNPSGGVYATTYPLWVLGVGNHHFVAIALDAAGNSTSTEQVNFVIGNGSGSNNGNSAPTVSGVQINGNFGLITLKAIAKDDVKLFDIEFLVDGKPTGWAEHLDTRPDAPANQYYVTYDATTLTSGPHRLAVKATDYDSNTTSSDEVVFNIDSTAGLTEIEPNNDIASANVVADNQFQIAGTLKNTKENSHVVTDYDYYKVTIPANKTLTANMLALPSTTFLSIVDSNGTVISDEPVINAPEEEVSYTNGANSQVVYIKAFAGQIVYTRDQYRLKLGYK